MIQEYEKKLSNYCTVRTILLLNNSLTDFQKLLYIIIIGFCNPICKASNKWFAHILNKSTEEVEEGLQALHSQGLITIQTSNNERQIMFNLR